MADYSLSAIAATEPVDEFDARIKSLDEWLDEKARGHERVLRLQAHPGVGLLTSLAPVHMPEPVSRFAGGLRSR
jgi:phosphopantetheine adenylyltransferase